MNKNQANIVGAIIGAVLGTITWKVTVYSAPFGIGPLILILVCAWGGVYVFGPHLRK
tara:strand:+ start:241 stop:411 length:171 start_codon:yes stop_codon:yes gene_type:complete